MAKRGDQGLGKDESVTYAFRVPKPLMAAWNAFVARSQAGVEADMRRSGQDVLRDVMRKLTGQLPPPASTRPAPSFGLPEQHGIDERKLDGGPKERIRVSLTATEHAAVSKIAEERECSVQWWIVSLIRAALTRGLTVGGAELKALAESNYQLMAIGRNLNQIAHHINADPTKHDMVRAAQIADLTAKIDEHRKHVAALIYASSQRWEIL